MLWPVFANSTRGWLIRTSVEAKAYRYCSSLLVKARALDRLRGDTTDEHAYDDGHDAAGDVNHLRDRARRTGGRTRRRAAGEDKSRRRRDDAEEGGDDVSPER